MSVNTVMQKRFAAWLDAQIAAGVVPTGEMLVSHRGRVVMRHQSLGLAKPVPIGEDMIYRIYSMTKPVVSLAVMMLFEEGKFQLSDPIWKFLGNKWKKQNMKVMDVDASTKAGSLVTIPCKKSITVHNLLTHSSGLAHGLLVPGMENPLDNYYASVGLGAGDVLFTTSKTSKTPEVESLAQLVDRLGDCPLLFQPGEHWQYSFSVDLLGRIVEVVSGQPLNMFLEERIFARLGMKDTAFNIPQSKAHRVCDMWIPAMPGKGGPKNVTDRMKTVKYTSGSAGLYSTASDYLLFAEMLLREGRCNQGKRIVGHKTLQWMTTNHLPGLCKGKRSMRECGFRGLANDQDRGIGFGLGFAILEDVSLDTMIGSKGSFFWAGAATTHFWVDPEEELAVVFCTQLLMPDPIAFPTLKPLRGIVYGALDYEDSASKSGQCAKCSAKSKL